MRRLRALGRDRRGVAAVEFALLAPMMVLLLFGSIEIINAVQVNRRVENVATSIADVVSRDTVVTNEERDGLWAALGPLMFPDETDDLSVRITSISINSSSSANAVWCERTGSVYPNIANGASISGLPSEMRMPGTSLIRVETTFDYRPILGFFFLDTDRRLDRRESASGQPQGRTITHVAYRRSRLVDPITRSTS